MSVWVRAADPPKPHDSTPENEIQITANQLIATSKEGYAEFSGEVRTTQADFVITSDRLRIYYEGDLVNSAKKNTGQNRIKKILATGNVKIKSAQYDAATDQLEYDVPTMVLVLSGANSAVISGKNSITGSKITLYRADGRVKVEGGQHKRVKAVFYSEGEASNPLTPARSVRKAGKLSKPD
ncbi:MAG: hypothetical protein JSW39_22880 [Desulfobacterales bacterium]|nr:MAG: hypothetical protein JSW39_22880 [Desulfobacterales bacterium]